MIRSLFLKLQRLRTAAQQLVTLSRDQGDILMAHPAETGDVEPGLDGEDLSRAQGRGTEAGLLVQIQPEAVPRAMKEPAPSAP